MVYSIRDKNITDVNLNSLLRRDHNLSKFKQRKRPKRSPLAQCNKFVPYLPCLWNAFYRDFILYKSSNTGNLC